MTTENIYGYIYITENLINGKKYIGRHVSKDFGDNYLGSGVIISRAIKKYGKNNFKKKILYVAYSKDELKFAEKLFIRARNAAKNLNYYNIADGEDPYAGYDEIDKLLLSYKIKQGLANMSDERKKQRLVKISKSQIGKKLSLETRKKISEKSKGSNNGFYGKRHSEEFKRKQSERKKKITGSLHRNSKPVLLLNDKRELIGEFANPRILSEYLKEKFNFNVSPKMIRTRTQNKKMIEQLFFVEYKSPKGVDANVK